MNLTMKIKMCCICTGRNSNQNVEFQTCRNWRPNQPNTTSNQQNAGLANQQPATTPVWPTSNQQNAGLANQQPAKRRFQKQNAGFENKTPVSKTKPAFWRTQS